MDGKKIMHISENTTNDILKSAAENYYNNGYMTGCIAGIKQGKKIGEGSGWIKGFIVGGLLTAGGFGLYLLSKKVIDEVDDLFAPSGKKDTNDNWREVKEDTVDGSESV